MKRFILAACLVSACAAWLYGQSRSDDPQEPSLEPRQELLADPPQDGSDDELRELRNLYIEVTRINAELMTADELRAALEAASVQQREQLATAKLREAIDIIAEVVKTYPETHAAAAAQMMLSGGDSREQPEDEFQDRNFKERSDEYGTPSSRFVPDGETRGVRRIEPSRDPGSSDEEQNGDFSEPSSTRF